MRWFLLASLGLSACAASQRPLPPGDGATPDLLVFVEQDGGDDGSAGDLAMKKPDLLPGPDLASSDLAGGCASPFINEVQTTGVSASDEWIELYNACSQAFVLTNWKLVYRSATGITDITLVSLSGSIPSHGYFLVANSTGYSGAPTPDATYSSGGLAQTGGGVGLRDGSGNLMDGVGWGSANNIFVETAAATAPGASQSIALHPDGHDTGNNSTDFTLSTPTPKAAN
jgi:hypothetical protein